MTSAPGNRWSEAAIVVLAAFTAFLTAYKSFNDADAKQDAKIDKLAIVICLDTPQRMERCQRLGLMQ